MMRAAIISTLLLATPAAATEEAAEPGGVRPQDIAEIDGCLAASAESGENPVSLCIGAISGICMEEHEGQSTAGMTECMARETAAWDAILNDQWPKLLTQAKEMDAASSLPEGGSSHEALRAAQQAWLAFRDAECAFAYSTGQDGTMRTLLGARCLLDMTAYRVIEFNYLLIERAQR